MEGWGGIERIILVPCRCFFCRLGAAAESNPREGPVADDVSVQEAAELEAEDHAQLEAEATAEAEAAQEDGVADEGAVVEADMDKIFLQASREHRIAC